MLAEKHKPITDKIWEIANRLRGPYRPPQYRLIMLPMVVLRRLDCVLAPTKAAVLARYARLIAAETPEKAIPNLLTKVVDAKRKQPLYNVSPYTFASLLGDSENIVAQSGVLHQRLLDVGARPWTPMARRFAAETLELYIGQ